MRQTVAVVAKMLDKKTPKQQKTKKMVLRKNLEHCLSP